MFIVHPVVQPAVGRHVRGCLYHVEWAARHSGYDEVLARLQVVRSVLRCRLGDLVDRLCRSKKGHIQVMICSKSRRGRTAFFTTQPICGIDIALVRVFIEPVEVVDHLQSLIRCLILCVC